MTGKQKEAVIGRQCKSRHEKTHRKIPMTK